MKLSFRNNRISYLSRQMEKANPFENIVKELEVEGKTYKYYSLPSLNDERVNKLPFSVRVLLESALRNCDEFNVKSISY